MRSPFSFEGELGRPAYAGAAAAVYLTQHVFVCLVFVTWGVPLKSPLLFWLSPLRALANEASALPGWTLLLGVVVTLLVAWLLVALAFRRALHVRAYAWLAAMAVAPALQIPVILWLGIAPQRTGTLSEPVPEWRRQGAGAAALGMLTGALLCVFAVVLSALILGEYGYALFMASPFVIGLSTAYIANRKARVSAARTCVLVTAALGLGALGLLGLALEGAICLVLASPLIVAMGLIGGILGRELARWTPRRTSTMLMSIVVVPLVMIGEVVSRHKAGFESVESIEVSAPPAAVWDAIVHMGPIPDAPAAPFRWGLAYPIDGEILGTGVGAVRRGVFSTGVAYERVTEWQPERKLSFIVLSDPPTMHELSPYRHVEAPHLNGYFRTFDARFTITPRSDGRTRLTLVTRHELDLEPALYWLPIAKWATQVNKRRVLKHFRRRAEVGG